MTHRSSPSSCSSPTAVSPLRLVSVVAAIIAMASLLQTQTRMAVYGWTTVVAKPFHTRQGRLFYSGEDSSGSSTSSSQGSSQNAADAGLVEDPSVARHVHVGSTRADENPCWQDIYDDDCAMSTMYSASFVAKNWIKAMKCAEGIEDCDMPERTSRPGFEGIDDVDVMDFLGLRRAKNLGGGGDSTKQTN